MIGALGSKAAALEEVRESIAFMSGFMLPAVAITATPKVEPGSTVSISKQIGPSKLSNLFLRPMAKLILASMAGKVKIALQGAGLGQP